jgi:hypothetical protein
MAGRRIQLSGFRIQNKSKFFEKPVFGNDSEKFGGPAQAEISSGNQEFGQQMTMDISE